MNDQTFNPETLDKEGLKSALENINRIIDTSRYPADSGMGKVYRAQQRDIIDNLKMRNRADDNK